MSESQRPGRTSPVVHLKRAFGWNLGRVTPSSDEVSRLAAAGVTDPTVQRYAAWRRSLLLVALVPILLAAVLATLDVASDGFDEYTVLGTAIYGAWLLLAMALPFVCVLGLRRWTRPGVGARVLLGAWLFSFLLPLMLALLPGVYHVESIEPSTAASAVAEHAGVDADKVADLEEMAVEFVAAGAAFLLLLPAVFSLIPGAVNGCLRVKSLLPPAQLPGWLLVTIAPVFPLFWLVMLVLVTPAVEGPLLLIGITLWAGSAVVYTLHARVFVQSRIGEAEAAEISRVKRRVAVVSLAGIACLVAFVATTQVAGLHVVGLDEDLAMSVRLEELADSDDEVGLEDVRVAYDESETLLYALNPSFLWSIVDLLAKLLLATVVFADLVLRATINGWRNERALRTRPESGAFDASAAAAASALGIPAD